MSPHEPRPGSSPPLPISQDPQTGPQPGSAWQTVRPNLRQWLLLFAQFYLLIQVFTIAPMLNAGEEFSLERAIAGAACGAIACAAMFAMLIRGTYFKYDLPSGRVKVRHWLGSWRSYPRSGYHRLEFSPVYGEIHEIGSDGRRRRVPVNAMWSNRTDWKSFVEGFHPSAGLPVVIRHAPLSEAAQASKPPSEGGAR